MRVAGIIVWGRCSLSTDALVSSCREVMSMYRALAVTRVSDIRKSHCAWKQVPAGTTQNGHDYRTRVAKDPEMRCMPELAYSQRRSYRTSLHR